MRFGVVFRSESTPKASVHLDNIICNCLVRCTGVERLSSRQSRAKSTDLRAASSKRDDMPV